MRRKKGQKHKTRLSTDQDGDLQQNNWNQYLIIRKKGKHIVGQEKFTGGGGSRDERGSRATCGKEGAAIIRAGVTK